MADSKQESKARETFTVPHVKGDWDKTVYLDNPHTDNLMTAMLSFGAEFWALKRRVLIVEKLMDDKKMISREMVEAYQPTGAELAQFDTDRDDFIQRVFGVLTRETAKKT